MEASEKKRLYCYRITQETIDMKKFDETLEKEQNWREFKLTDKWTTVFIESPDTISHEDTVSMIMRNEDMFSGHSGSGNDKDFGNFCRDYVRVPKEIPVWIQSSLRDSANQGDSNSLGALELLENTYESKLKEFRTKWNQNPSASIFRVELFGSSFVGGPYSFVNYKTNRVGEVQSIGKWAESLEECADEILWFAKTYPQYKFFVTFMTSEDGYGYENHHNAFTLRLFNGKVEVVKTRTEKETEYLYKINHLKGSTCAEKVSWITDVLYRLRYYHLRNYVVSLFEKMFPNLERENHYNGLADIFECRSEKYFDKVHACMIMDEWLYMLRAGERR